MPVDDEYKYQREYANGPLYSAVTGYFTLNQGNTGIEGALNDYLSGTANEQFLDQLNAIITGQNPKGAAVELTIDPGVQQAAWDALGDLKGAVVAIDPKTGAHPGHGLEAELRPDRPRDARPGRVHGDVRRAARTTPTTR